MLSTNQGRDFKHGVMISAQDSDFEEGLQAAVDYRGDVTIELKDGSKLDGFLFNSSNGRLDLFPKDSPKKQSLPLEDLERIAFTGKDEAAGKSWEEWVAKREAKKNSKS